MDQTNENLDFIKKLVELLPESRVKLTGLIEFDLNTCDKILQYKGVDITIKLLESVHSQPMVLFLTTLCINDKCKKAIKN